MECLVRDWHVAAVWTQPHLTAASVGPKKVSHGGHQPTVFQKYWRPQGHQSKNLQNLLIIQITNDKTENLFFMILPAVYDAGIFYWTGAI